MADDRKDICLINNFLWQSLSWVRLSPLFSDGTAEGCEPHRNSGDCLQELLTARYSSREKDEVKPANQSVEPESYTAWLFFST